MSGAINGFTVVEVDGNTGVPIKKPTPLGDETEIVDRARAWRIADDERSIRAWVDLNTIGRDNPNAPISLDIANLITLLSIIDDIRAKI